MLNGNHEGKMDHDFNLVIDDGSWNRIFSLPSYHT